MPQYVLEDIDEQMRLAEAPFAPLRDLPGKQRVCRPVFAGSTDVKADADFINDGFLIDCKALTRPHRVGREEVQQLAGYLLLDYDDRYDIREVGFYLSRQGALIRWGVPEFLTMLGSRSPLPQLRAALQEHLRRERPHLAPQTQGTTDRPKAPASEAMGDVSCCKAKVESLQ